MHFNSCSTTECVSGDCSSEVKQENLSVVKEEPDDVCCVICFIFYLNSGNILCRVLLMDKVSGTISVIF